MVPNTATDDENQNGYGFYAGVQVPAPYGKVGLEYNYGSKYWTPFTQGQDDSLGSKLATRGHVGEAYYIFDINPNMFIKARRPLLRLRVYQQRLTGWQAAKS